MSLMRQASQANLVPDRSLEELGQQVEVDEAVQGKLPPGTAILSASRHGTSRTRYVTSLKLVAALPDASVRTYLLRTAVGDKGKAMMRGEFESHSSIHSIMPTFIPRPVAWGSLKSSQQSTYYFLSIHHERLSSNVNAAMFAAMLADLHLRSRTAEARFGFHATTFLADGEVPNERAFTDSWEEYFTHSLRNVLELEESINGDDEELSRIRDELVRVVIPRLLRPLQSEGRRIRPSLIHGDLRPDNAGTVDTSHGVMIFSPAALYAHHEYEFAVWRNAKNSFGSRLLRQYIKHLPISEPRDDFDDRNALYSIRCMVMDSIRYPGSEKYRRSMLEEMKRLVGKFWLQQRIQRPVTRHVPLLSEDWSGSTKERGDHAHGRMQRAGSADAGRLVPQPGGGGGTKGGRSASGAASGLFRR